MITGCGFLHEAGRTNHHDLKLMDKACIYYKYWIILSGDTENSEFGQLTGIGSMCILSCLVTHGNILNH